MNSSEPPRTIGAHEAARLLLGRRFLVVIGSMENRRHRRALNTLCGTFGGEAAVMVSKPAYSPQLSKPMIGNAATEPPPAKETYQEVFTLFLPDTAFHRQVADGICLAVSRNECAPKLGEFTEQGPLLLDGHKKKMMSAAATVLSVLKSLDAGKAVDLTGISRNTSGGRPPYAIALGLFTVDIFSDETCGLERDTTPELSETEQEICFALNVTAEEFSVQKSR
jgi:hypothetical protein